jgi:hypothetical protein
MPETDPAENIADGSVVIPGGESQPVTACETKLAIAQKEIGRAHV